MQFGQIAAYVEALAMLGN